MDDALLELILARLDTSSLGREAADVVLAACEGEAALTAVLGGAAPARHPRDDARPRPEPAGAYLSSLTLTGFRGAGRPATLPLQPGPGLRAERRVTCAARGRIDFGGRGEWTGAAQVTLRKALTLVLGRNGSGKSSFAEGLEMLLTGAVRRWDDERSAVWGQGWRNLHDPDPVELGVELWLEGSGSATVVRRWEPGAELAAGQASVQVAGEKRAGMDRLGWDADLVTYRPFLSHAELEAFFGAKPSQLYDLLAAVLGLDELSATAERLRDARRQAETPFERRPR